MPKPQAGSGSILEAGGSRRTTQASQDREEPQVDHSDGVHHLQQMLRQDSADQMAVRA